MTFCCGDFKRLKPVLWIILIFLWISHLVYADGYFSVYALCCAVSAYSMSKNLHAEVDLSRRDKSKIGFVSMLLSLAVVLANYRIFDRIRNLEEISLETNTFLNGFEFLLTFVCGISVFYHIVRYAVQSLPAAGYQCSERSNSKNNLRIFLCTTASIWAIYLIYLFLVVYPGSVSGDSVGQILQGVRNKYINNHPVWHTLMIKGLMQLGYWIFDDSNAAVATYHAIQGLMLAACFGYSLVTLYQIGAHTLWIAAAYGMYAFLPYNISFSATMWKDVLFGAAMLLFVVSAYRIFRSVGDSRKLNEVLLFIGGIGLCLMRTNGLASLLAASVLMIPFLWKNRRRMVYILISVLALGWVLTGPVLTLLNVRETPFVEVLSIPAQQISRVIVDECELTEYEEEMLSKVIDFERVHKKYDPQVSDPIKDELLKTNKEYLQEHLAEYGKIWISLGLRYPDAYLKAWIDQTRGYWNGGYEYYIYAEYVRENDLGIYMVPQSNILFKLVKAYFTLSRETVMFEPFQSIGLNVWILFVLWFVNIFHHRKEALLFAPCFVIIIGLMLGAPVFALFRYVYPVFTSLPFLAGITAFSTGEDKIV